MQQPVKLMTCTFIPAKRLGCAPWLKDVDHYTYSRKRPNKSKWKSVHTIIYFVIMVFKFLVCTGIALHVFVSTNLNGRPV